MVILIFHYIRRDLIFEWYDTRMGSVVVSVDGMCCWSATLESTNCLAARLSKYFGYLSFKIQSRVDLILVRSTTTLTIMHDIASAEIFLDTLNHCDPSAKFTMEVERNASLPFIAVELLNLHVAPRITTKVYVKPTDTGLLLHYQSHVDIRYKRSLITTMLDRAYRISSYWSYFSQECDRLKTAFLKLKYPKHLLNLAVKQFVLFWRVWRP